MSSEQTINSNVSNKFPQKKFEDKAIILDIIENYKEKSSR